MSTHNDETCGCELVKGFYCSVCGAELPEWNDTTDEVCPRCGADDVAWEAVHDEGSPDA